LSAYLLDVNVLVALAWPTHVHHLAARAWFDRESAGGWATCPITQLGFVRVSSNPKAIRDAVHPHQAIALLQRLTGLPGHRFWADEAPVTPAGPFASLSLVGHRHVTDACLLALARHHGGRLATLDRGVPGLIAARDERSEWVELIPVGD
jgi:uncharacterized protein